MNRDLLQKYDRPVPRYTSYPTAPHFRHTLSSEAYADRLHALPAQQSVSLYFHIPFCRHLCLYCGCNTQVVNHDAPLHDYMSTLQKEVRLAAQALGRQQPVSHLHFGGGSPNYASIDDLKGLLDLVKERFLLNADTVIAMEMDPRLLTEEKANALVELGINRVSFGIQDFQPDVQKAINRIQPYEHVKNCVAWLRDAGITSINFDMIYGLPLQTLDGMHDSIAKAVSLHPERVALFGYAHVPWFKAHQKKLEPYGLPDLFARFDLAESARADLIAAGYVHVGIDHFAVPEDSLAQAVINKTLHRNFQGYTTDREDILIGFGQTSIGSLPDAYVQNTDGNKAYRERIERGAFPLEKACLITAEDKFRRAVIEQIMCYGVVDVMALPQAEAFGADALQAARAALAGMIEDGLVCLNGSRLAVTEQGRPFTRLAASAFDTYLNPVETRHARAV